MPTVTGLTAARMQEIEDAPITDANVVGEDLILITRGGAQINAGSVEGPQGPAGSSLSSSPWLNGPPANPTDGQIWIATNVPTGDTGICWMFRYHADSASAYKWEFIGGSPQTTTLAGLVSTTNVNGEWKDGPVVDYVRAGDYRFEFGCEISVNTNGYGAIMHISNSTLGLHPNAIWLQYSPYSEWETMMSAGVFLAAPAGGYMNTFYQVWGGGGGAAQFKNRWLSLTPIRIA
jgi:hypothetical protein